jgi:hypothetical protein
MSLYWLKRYSVEPIMASRFDCDEDTVRANVWKYCKAIQALLKYKVRLHILLRAIKSLMVRYLHCVRPSNAYTTGRLCGPVTSLIIIQMQPRGCCRLTELIVASKNREIHLIMIFIPINIISHVIRMRSG